MRLGAALLDERHELSGDLRENLIRRARMLGGPSDHAHARVKEELARFLHEHRGEY